MIEQKNVPCVYPAALLAHNSASAWVSRLSLDLAMHSLNSPCSSYSFIQAQAGLHQQTGVCVCEKEWVHLCQFLNSFINDSKFWILTSIYSKCPEAHWTWYKKAPVWVLNNAGVCTVAAEHNESPSNMKPLTFNSSLACCYGSPLWAFFIYHSKQTHSFTFFIFHQFIHRFLLTRLGSCKPQLNTCFLFATRHSKRGFNDVLTLRMRVFTFCLHS